MVSHRSGAGANTLRKESRFIGRVGSRRDENGEPGRLSRLFAPVCRWATRLRRSRVCGQSRMRGYVSALSWIPEAANARQISGRLSSRFKHYDDGASPSITVSALLNHGISAASHEKVSTRLLGETRRGESRTRGSASLQRSRSIGALCHKSMTHRTRVRAPRLRPRRESA